MARASAIREGLGGDDPRHPNLRHRRVASNSALRDIPNESPPTGTPPTESPPPEQVDTIAVRRRTPYRAGSTLSSEIKPATSSDGTKGEEKLPIEPGPNEQKYRLLAELLTHEANTDETISTPQRALYDRHYRRAQQAAALCSRAHGAISANIPPVPRTLGTLPAGDARLQFSDQLKTRFEQMLPAAVRASVLQDPVKPGALEALRFDEAVTIFSKRLGEAMYTSLIHDLDKDIQVDHQLFENFVEQLPIRSMTSALLRINKADALYRYDRSVDEVRADIAELKSVINDKAERITKVVFEKYRYGEAIERVTASEVPQSSSVVHRTELTLSALPLTVYPEDHTQDAVPPHPFTGYMKSDLRYRLSRASIGAGFANSLEKLLTAGNLLETAAYGAMAHLIFRSPDLSTRWREVLPSPLTATLTALAISLRDANNARISFHKAINHIEQRQVIRDPNSEITLTRSRLTASHGAAWLDAFEQSATSPLKLTLAQISATAKAILNELEYKPIFLLTGKNRLAVIPGLRTNEVIGAAITRRHEREELSIEKWVMRSGLSFEKGEQQLLRCVLQFEDAEIPKDVEKLYEFYRRSPRLVTGSELDAACARQLELICPQLTALLRSGRYSYDAMSSPFRRSSTLPISQNRPSQA